MPVARWEYTTDLPETDSRSGTASAVAYLIPSRDTLDILSINTPTRGLAAIRGVGEQLISTLRVPLTIDADQFGRNMWWAFAQKGLMVAVPLAGVLGAGRGSGGGGQGSVERRKRERHGEAGRE